MTKPEKKAEEKKPLVDENGVAVSPFADYPGEIRFPRVFNGELYRTITSALGNQKGDWKGDFFALLPYWRVVQSVADVDLVSKNEHDGLDTIDGETEFDAVPGQVLRWARDAASEYVDRFLTYER